MNSVPNCEIDYRKYIIPRNSYATYHPFLSNGERYIPLEAADFAYFQLGPSNSLNAPTVKPSTFQSRELTPHQIIGYQSYVKPGTEIVSQHPAPSKSTQIASKNINLPSLHPNRKFLPGGQSQFTVENAHYKDNPFVFRGRTHTAGRMQNKLNRSGFDMDEVKASFVLPGAYFQKTIAADEQELFLYRVEPFVSVESFNQCNFKNPTLELIANRGLTQMTAIQKYAIPLLMTRENYNTSRALIIRSPCGSGKTLAVALPIISRIFHMRNKEPTKKGPFAIFLAHNNVACAQLCKELLAICPDGGPIRVGMSCGSQDPKVINRLIEEGVDILVCTSGRADNHFFKCAGGSVRELQIQRIRYLVLDEADIFLNFNKFYRYVDPIFQKLKSANGKIKLICLTSCYQSVNRFKQLLPADAKAGIVSVGCETIPPTVRMKCFNITGQHKHDALMSLLKNKSLRDDPDRPPKTIIYVKENDRCAQLASRLKGEGYLAKEIASQDSTNEMLKTMNSFLQGDYDIIVTQDLMSRMINVPDLKVVVHYDICEEKNHHNILSSCGRVGRLGNIGYCFIFYDRKTDLLAVDVLRKVKDRMSFTDEMNSVVDKWKILGVDDQTIFL